MYIYLCTTRPSTPLTTPNPPPPTLLLRPPQNPNKQTEYCDGSSYSALVPEPIPNAGVFANRTLYYRGQRVHQAFMEEVEV